MNGAGSDPGRRAGAPSLTPDASRRRRWITALAAITVFLLLLPVFISSVINLTPLYRESVSVSSNGLAFQYTIVRPRAMHVDESGLLRVEASVINKADLVMRDGAYRPEAAPQQMSCDVITTRVFEYKLAEQYSAQGGEGTPGFDHGPGSGCAWLLTPSKSGDQTIALTVGAQQIYNRVGDAPKSIAIAPGPPRKSLLDKRVLLVQLPVWKAWLGPENVPTLLAIITGFLTLLQVFFKDKAAPSERGAVPETATAEAREPGTGDGQGGDEGAEAVIIIASE